MFDDFRNNYNYIQSVIMRYFRIMPSVLTVIMITRALSSISKDSYSCDDIACQHWWRNVLMIQNVFVDPGTDYMVSFKMMQNSLHMII